MNECRFFCKYFVVSNEGIDRRETTSSFVSFDDCLKIPTEQRKFGKGQSLRDYIRNYLFYKYSERSQLGDSGQNRQGFPCSSRITMGREETGTDSGADSSTSNKRKVTVLKAADEPSEEMIASVVTQVGRDSGQNAASGREEEDIGEKETTSWFAKLKKSVCCFSFVSGDVRERDIYVHESDRSVQLADICRWPEPVIGPPSKEDAGKKTLILDLDETLVHSSFRPVPSPDFVIPVEIDGRVVDVYVIKRPYVDEFLKAVGPRFEVVVFTASLGKYADPLLDLLDKHNVIKWRLFREACYPFEGSYVKDLQCMGRDPKSMILVDNSPHSYAFQPENAVPIGTFIDDMEDQELLDCLDTLLAVESAPDVRPTISAELRRKDIEIFGAYQP